MRLCLLALALALLSSGCASIVSRTSVPVSVDSSPSGVTVEVRDENGRVVHRGTTPFTVELRTSDGYFDGMDYTLDTGRATAPLTSRVNGWYVGNIIFGGLLGFLIIDPATGAMWTLPDTGFIQDIVPPQQ